MLRIIDKKFCRDDWDKIESVILDTKISEMN
jgi:hypothetical protein